MPRPYLFLREGEIGVVAAAGILIKIRRIDGARSNGHFFLILFEIRLLTIAKILQQRRVKGLFWPLISFHAGTLTCSHSSSGTTAYPKEKL